MFVVGFATEDEIATLLKAGYDVEEAKGFGRVVGRESDSLMLPPAPSPSNTRAVAIFLDTSLAEVVHNNEHGSYNPDGFIDRGEHHKYDELAVWSELPLDEEFLRIVLLESRVMGKDVTVEPYKSWNNELAWRRTDKYLVSATEKTMSSEQVHGLQATVTRMQQAFSNQKDEMARRVRHHLCSHKTADGFDATVGVPVSGERWCNACKAQFD